MPVTISKHMPDLYVIPCGEGFTTMGFDHLLEQSRKAHAFIGAAMPDHPRGSIEAYEAYEKANQVGAAKNRMTGERDLSNLCPELRVYEGDRIEATDRFGERKRFWVGRSTGWRPCHLEIATARDMGGDAAFGPYTDIRLIKRGPR